MTARPRDGTIPGMTSRAKNLDALSKLDPNLATTGAQGDLLWYDVAWLSVEGMGWTETDGPYERLPRRAKGIVPGAVWDLARCSAGICAGFVTDATRISARWTLKNARLAMDHMPATGVSGLDLYTRVGRQWRWLGVGRPTEIPTNEVELTSGLPDGSREYRLYLPLYNGVTEVKLGIPKGATLAPSPGRSLPSQRPVVFYGTSIVQGGCAARPGMAYPAILGRSLAVPTINLGFSGNGRMEPEVGRLLAEIDAAAFVLDCLPNVEEPLVTERTGPLVRILRQSHPGTPIVLVENITYTNAYLVGSRQARCTTSNRAYRNVYERLRKAGVPQLWYVEGDRLLGDDGEGTVDGTHATDVGFLRIAQVLCPVLARALHAGAGRPRRAPRRS